jgi:drug/metabolite transporter (DMT)-like permease
MSNKLKPYIVLHAGIFLVSFTGILGKAISLREGILVWYRLFLCVVILSIFGYIFKKFEPLRKEDKKKAFIIGALFCIHWLLWYSSVKFANTSIAMSTISTVAVFNALVEPFINKRPFKLSELLLGAIASIGMILIFQAKSGSSFGVIAGIVSALVVAIASVMNKNLTEKNNAYSLTLWEFTAALITMSVIMPFYLMFNKELSPNEHIALIPTGKDIWLLLVFVVVCTLIPFIMNLYALRHVSSFTSNLSFNMEPIWGIAAAILIFQEQKELSVQFFIGLSLILFSVVIFSAVKYKKSLNSKVAI